VRLVPYDFPGVLSLRDEMIRSVVSIPFASNDPPAPEEIAEAISPGEIDRDIYSRKFGVALMRD
jgi:hypothetical protein